MNHVLSIRRGIIFLTLLMVLIIVTALTFTPGWVTTLLLGMVIGTTASVAYMLIRALITENRNEDPDAPMPAPPAPSQSEKDTYLLERFCTHKY